MSFDTLETTRLASNDAEFEDLEYDLPKIEVENEKEEPCYSLPRPTKLLLE
jgi:hypothetical protein